MSILDIFRSNERKIANQEKLIKTQREQLEEAWSQRQSVEDKVKGLKDKLIKGEDEVTSLNRQISKIQSDKKLEIEERDMQRTMHDEKIAHLVKIKEESLQIAHDKKVVELDGEKQEAIAAVKDKYQDKVESHLEKRNTELKEMYSEILERLPNLNAKLSIKEKN